MQFSASFRSASADSYPRRFGRPRGRAKRRSSAQSGGTRVAATVRLRSSFAQIPLSSGGIEDHIPPSSCRNALASHLRRRRTVIWVGGRIYVVAKRAAELTTAELTYRCFSYNTRVGDLESHSGFWRTNHAPAALRAQARR
jgi:hypothetical protein